MEWAYHEIVGSRFAILVLLVAGCRVTGTFTCTSDQQCRNGDTTGSCQPNGACSFGDTSCPSGQRYDPSAGALAGTCVAPLGDAGVDAVDAVDAPAAFAVRFNLGGPTYVGTSDFPGTWIGDTTGQSCPNTTPLSTTMPVNGVIDQALFQTQEFRAGGGMQCNFSALPLGNYQVSLLFSELYYGCPGGPNQPRPPFNIRLFGNVVGVNIQTSVDGGGCATTTGHAFVKRYPIAVTAGTVDLKLEGQDTALDAIEILSVP